jgi:hypothetical protein
MNAISKTITECCNHEQQVLNPPLLIADNTSSRTITSVLASGTQSPDDRKDACPFELDRKTGDLIDVSILLKQQRTKYENTRKYEHNIGPILCI